MKRVLLLTPVAIAGLMAFHGGRTGQGYRSYSTGAIVAIEQIHTAEVEYYSRYGSYASSLNDLVPFLKDRQIAAGNKDRYRFRLTAGPSAYQVYALPDTGRAFYSDQTMSIGFSDGPEPPTAASKELR